METPSASAISSELRCEELSEHTPHGLPGRAAVMVTAGVLMY